MKSSSDSAGESSGPGPRWPQAFTAALWAHTTLTLAYTDEHGLPQACSVFYAVTDSGELVFVSSTRTRHGRLLAAGPRPVAVTMQADQQSWTTLTGIQAAGCCRRATGPQQLRARAAYTARFPFTGQAATLTRALSTADHWIVDLDRIRLIDNRHGFARKQEWGSDTRVVDPTA